jgi:FtsZ-binding cell division protein ZapB
MGSRVNVVEQSGRRVRIDQPIVGWCSLNSSNGDTILKPLDANQQQKVAPTPRSGQAAVSNLEKKVQQAQEAIQAAQQDGRDIELLAQEKEQLEARIADLQHKNEQQQKIFDDWKKASTNNTTATGTAPTDMKNIQFRNGDAVLINTNDECKLKGIAIVRAVISDDKGEELIGCDFQAPTEGTEVDHPGPFDGTYNGEQKWVPKEQFVGVWLRRTNLKNVLVSDILLATMEKLEQENTDLKYYERTAKAMIKKVKQYAAEYKKVDNISVGDQSFEGKTYSAQFYDSFKGLTITEE